ncbi:MAG: ScyD/ScyE family protein, partial [Pyrinomonadaceae bacterium]|nr:ScyD/ScyE family protein [Pyrinomonadaceae bacterium]
AFVSTRDGNKEIYVVSATGGGATRLTNNPAEDISPTWSPLLTDQQIAFVSNRGGDDDVYVMNADGTNPIDFTSQDRSGDGIADDNGADDIDPAWAPSGTILAFASNRDGNRFEIYRLATNGTLQLRLTNNSFDDVAPSWPPGQITFQSDRDGNDEIYTMNANGANQVRITFNPPVPTPTPAPDPARSFDIDPARSSDGARLVFVSSRDAGDNLEIYAANSDGSGVRRLTNDPASDIDPAIQPLQGAAALGSVALSAATYTVNEGQRTLVITVTRTGGTGAASVEIATVPGSASDRSDYAAIERTVRFAANETSKTVTFSVLDDLRVEGDETLTVTLSGVVNTTLGTPSSAIVTITDNDGALTSEFATGLRAPTKIIFINSGHLLVAEAGNGPNTGRLSILDRSSGARRTLLDNLPAGLAPPNNDPSGPSGLELRGRMLFITIGQGDATLNGPAPGTEMPNPNPSSPIFNSVLAIDLSAVNEATTAGFTLTAANQTTLKSGSQVTLNDGSGQTLTIRLVTDFPDFVAEPRPNFAGNVRPTNSFGLVAAANFLYVVNAGLNSVSRVDINAGTDATLATFAPIPRPSPVTPPGGPVVEAVPDSIRLFGDQLLVPFLTGFPFQPGLAQVRTVDIATGNNAPFITGLTSAIDVLPVRTGGADRFFVLEFSANMLQGAPGRLRLFNSPSGAPVVTVDNLMTPTSLARDERTGSLFVTEIFTGRVVQITNPAFPANNPIDDTGFFVRQQYLDFLSREPDPAGFTAWVNVLTNCPDQFNRDPNSPSALCDRVHVSSSFFRSGEFQIRGASVIRSYRAAFNRDPTFREFIRDLAAVGGATEEEALANRARYPDDFVQRPEFRAIYESLSNAAYVNALIVNTGVTLPNRDQLVADLNTSARTRAQVFNDIVDSSQFTSAAFNRTFVLTEYFGYLRRDPEPAGFQMWLDLLNNNPNDFRTMVIGFLYSTEYRARFGQ